MKNGSHYQLVCSCSNGEHGFRQEIIELQANDATDAIEKAQAMVQELAPQSFEVRMVIRNVQKVIYRSGITLVA